METILRKIEKIIPRSVYRFFQPIYHYLLSLAGAIIYKFPGRKLNIVGVTGTKGKSTTVEIINSILEEAKFKTALTSTIHFKVGDKVTKNKYKMSMPGRFFMQKFLSEALKEKCDWVILEMTSEGAKQYRHKFINLNELIFTNLHKEHIESHGSFEKYREAKLSLLENLKGRLIANGDDPNTIHFTERYKGESILFKEEDAKPYSLQNNIEMKFNNSRIYSNLKGKFNVYNILAAATFAQSIGLPDDVIKRGVEKIKVIEGRTQMINEGQNFDVVVDYAHTKESLEALYETFPSRKICVLGNTGGGRDKWKRKEMAKVAEKYCDQIILTNEDPYDENPMDIVSEMKDAITSKPVEIIMDRKLAIKKALSLAKENDAVLITGKGTDPYIMEANGKKTPWSDASVTRELLK